MSLPNSEVLTLNRSVFIASRSTLDRMLHDNEPPSGAGDKLKEILQLIPGVRLADVEEENFKRKCIVDESTNQVVVLLRGESAHAQVAASYSRPTVSYKTELSNSSRICFTHNTAKDTTTAYLYFSLTGEFQSGKIELLKPSFIHSARNPRSSSDNWALSYDDLIIFSSTGEVRSSGKTFQPFADVGSRINVVNMISSIANQTQFENPIPIDQLVIASR